MSHQSRQAHSAHKGKICFHCIYIVHIYVVKKKMETGKNVFLWLSTRAHLVHFSNSAAHSDVNVSAIKTLYKSLKNYDILHDHQF